MSPATLSERAASWGYLAAWRAVGRMPEAPALGLFTRLGERAYRRDGRGVQTLRAMENFTEHIDELYAGRE